MTSGRYIKLNLIEFVQVVDYINTEVRLQKGASCIVPITAVGDTRSRLEHCIH